MAGTRQETSEWQGRSDTMDETREMPEKKNEASARAGKSHEASKLVVLVFTNEKRARIENGKRRDSCIRETGGRQSAKGKKQSKGSLGSSRKEAGKRRDGGNERKSQGRK
jgi:hypothetical protein